MNINEPTKDQIDRIKAQFPDRSLHLVEAVDGEDVYSFVMTGPSETEYKKYSDEVLDGREAKNEKLQNEAIRKALYHAILAQVRHPEREEAKRIFAMRPAMIEQFAATLRESAGSNIEVRSKKL